MGSEKIDRLLPRQQVFTSSLRDCYSGGIPLGHVFISVTLEEKTDDFYFIKYPNNLECGYVDKVVDFHPYSRLFRPNGGIGTAVVLEQWTDNPRLK